MSRIRRSLSFSNVVAVMALFFALGGSAYAVAAGKIDGSQIAASSIPGNRLEAKAVGTNQLKPSSIGNAQLKGNAVATKQLQSGAVTGGKIKAEIFESGGVGASGSAPAARAPELIRGFIAGLGLPTRLGEVGVREVDFELIAEDAMRDFVVAFSPVTVSVGGVKVSLRTLWSWPWRPRQISRGRT